MTGARRRLASFTASKDPAEKVGVARVMGEVLDADLTPSERFAAEAIVHDLCADTVEAVRVALARSVAASPQLPRALAERLANDIEEAAIPLLQLSPVLTDEVLTAIIQTGTAGQVEAAARRTGLSERVSDAIVERRHLPAVSLLVRNPTAEIAASTWEKAIERYGDEPGFVEAAEARGGLPPAVTDKLVQAAKAHVRAFLVRYLNVPDSSIPSEDAIDLAGGGQKLLPRVVPDTIEPGRFAMILKKHGRLDAKVVLKALCSGEFDFLVHALAQMTSFSFAYAQKLLFSPDPDVLGDFLVQAGIERRFVPVFRSLLAERDGVDRAAYQRLAMARVNAVLESGRGGDDGAGTGAPALPGVDRIAWPTPPGP